MAESDQPDEVLDHTNYQGSFQELVELITKEKEKGKSLFSLFVFLLQSACSDLIRLNQFDQLFENFQTAEKLFPEDALVLNEIGFCLFRLDKTVEAFKYFQKAYTLDRTCLKAYRNLQNVKNQLIERWHFRMLNDSKRNDSFRSALEAYITKGNKSVLDIGSGTGVLSIFAHHAGASSVISCERSEIMIDIIEKVFEANELSSKIQVIPKLSNDIVIGKDLKGKVALVVSETVDSGIFGEGILQTLIHAKQNLLEVSGKIIPYKVKVFVSGYQSRTLSSSQILLSDITEYLFLDQHRIVASKTEPYDAEYVQHIKDFKIVTGSDNFVLDFNNLEEMKNYYSGKITSKLQISSDVCDYLDGFMVRFNLYLDEDDEENFITTAPDCESCWNQAVFKLNQRMLLNKHQVLNVSVSCKEGILQLLHNYNLDDENFYELEEQVIKFLNDSDYLNELENGVCDLLKKCESIEKCLDLLPFPFIGLMLLKEKRLTRLYCQKSNEKLIKLLATKNCISEKALEFLDRGKEENDSIKYDLIIMSPFDPIGDLNSEQISEISCLSNSLKPNGNLIPCKIQVYGELINSDWLFSCCKVNEEKICQLKIDEFVNKFSTEHHLDLNNFPYSRLTDEFKISDVALNDQLHENNVKVLMKNINLQVHAVLIFFKIQFTKKNVELYSTKRNNSYIKRSAFVLRDALTVQNSHVNVNFIQNNGIFKCIVTK